MWTLYLASHRSFGRAVGIEPGTILNNLLEALVQNLVIGPASLPLFLVAAFPILAIFTYGSLGEHRRLVSAWDSPCKQGKSGIGVPSAVREQFGANTTYDCFIPYLFSGINRLATGVGLIGVDSCIVHRFFCGGSDAVAALVGVDGRLLIRKFATRAPA